MTRQDIAANGITSVFCLVVRDTSPPEYLCPPNRFGDITSPEEERAEVWVREIDAEEMRRRAEHLAGLKLEMVRRPTLIGSSILGYCPTCGHTGSHNPFCGSLRELFLACSRCGDQTRDPSLIGIRCNISRDCKGVQIRCAGRYQVPAPSKRVRQGDRDLDISVTELAAGMATATYREEREEAGRG